MKTRFTPAVLATAALLLFAAAPVAIGAGGGEGTVTVMVMKHACNPDVQNLDDFNAIVEGAESPVAALAATVLACPAVVNPGDDTSDGVKADAADFSFTVEDAAGTNDLPAESIAAKLCESDLGLDANGDGNVSEDVCLDISHYAFEGLTNGPITITETQPPDGYRFGEVLFTPSEIDDNNDADSLVSVDREAGVIELDTTADEDGMVMLHVYNFQNEIPDSATATETVTENGSLDVSLVLALAVAGAFGVWFSTTLRRRERTLG